MGKTALYVSIIVLLALSVGSAYAQVDLNQYDNLSSLPSENQVGNDGWLISSFITGIQTHTYNFVKSTYGELSGITHGYFIFFVSVWFIYTVIKMFFLQAQTPPLNVGMQFFLILIASTLLTTGGAGAFFSLFYEPIMEASVKMSSFFMTKATNGDGNFSHAIAQLENLFANSIDIALYLIESVDGFDIAGFLKAVFLGLVLISSVAGLVFLFAAYWSYSIFAIHILFALTPFMIAMYPFKALRQYPEKWFAGVINYAVIPIVLSISMGITIMISQQEVSEYLAAGGVEFTEGGNADAGEAGASITFIILVSMLSFLVHLRVGDIASHLTGGISTGLSSTWNMGINTMANVNNLGINAANLGMKGGNGLYNKVKGRIGDKI